MNEIGLDLNAVGNHEFDEGTTELLRMQNGGCHPIDGCLDGDGFAGADFEFLAANVVNETTGETLFPPYSIENFNGAKIAFIGMTLEGTPNIVSPSGVAGLRLPRRGRHGQRAGPASSQRRGVEAIVVLIHEGGSPTALDINGCAGVSGPIVDIVDRLDAEVDLVVSGHTHQPYNCVIDGKPGDERLLVRAPRHRHRHAGRPAPRRTSRRIAINNRIVTRDVAADPDDHGADRPLQRTWRRRSPTGRSATSPRDITRTADDSREQLDGQRHRRRPARRDRRPGDGATRSSRS